VEYVHWNWFASHHSVSAFSALSVRKFVARHCVTVTDLPRSRPFFGGGGGASKLKIVLKIIFDGVIAVKEVLQITFVDNHRCCKQW